MTSKFPLSFIMAFTIFFVMVAPCLSSTLSNNGYNVSVAAKYKKKKSLYKIWGTVSGGEKCEQLNIHLSFIGSGKNISFEKDILVENYTPESGGGEFSAKKKSPTGSKKDFLSVTKVIVQCED